MNPTVLAVVREHVPAHLLRRCAHCDRNVLSDDYVPLETCQGCCATFYCTGARDCLRKDAVEHASLCLKFDDATRAVFLLDGEAQARAHMQAVLHAAREHGHMDAAHARATENAFAWLMLVLEVHCMATMRYVVATMPKPQPTTNAWDRDAGAVDLEDMDATRPETADYVRMTDMLAHARLLFQYALNKEAMDHEAARFAQTEPSEADRLDHYVRAIHAPRVATFLEVNRSQIQEAAHVFHGRHAMQTRKRARREQKTVDDLIATMKFKPHASRVNEWWTDMHTFMARVTAVPLGARGGWGLTDVPLRDVATTVLVEYVTKLIDFTRLGYEALQGVVGTGVISARDWCEATGLAAVISNADGFITRHVTRVLRPGDTAQDTSTFVPDAVAGAAVVANAALVAEHLYIDVLQHIRINNEVMGDVQSFYDSFALTIEGALTGGTLTTSHLIVLNNSTKKVTCMVQSAGDFVGAAMSRETLTRGMQTAIDFDMYAQPQRTHAGVPLQQDLAYPTRLDNESRYRASLLFQQSVQCITNALVGASVNFLTDVITIKESDLMEEYAKAHQRLGVGGTTLSRFDKLKARLIFAFNRAEIDDTDIINRAVGATIDGIGRLTGHLELARNLNRRRRVAMFYGAIAVATVSAYHSGWEYASSGVGSPLWFHLGIPVVQALAFRYNPLWSMVINNLIPLFFSVQENQSLLVAVFDKVSNAANEHFARVADVFDQWLRRGWFAAQLRDFFGDPSWALFSGLGLIITGMWMGWQSRRSNMPPRPVRRRNRDPVIEAQEAADEARLVEEAYYTRRGDNAFGFLILTAAWSASLIVLGGVAPLTLLALPTTRFIVGMDAIAVGVVVHSEMSRDARRDLWTWCNGVIPTPSIHMTWHALQSIFSVSMSGVVLVAKSEQFYSKVVLPFTSLMHVLGSAAGFIVLATRSVTFGQQPCLLTDKEDDDDEQTAPVGVDAWLTEDAVRGQQTLQHMRHGLVRVCELIDIKNARTAAMLMERVEAACYTYVTALVDDLETDRVRDPALLATTGGALGQAVYAWQAHLFPESATVEAEQVWALHQMDKWCASVFPDPAAAAAPAADAIPNKVSVSNVPKNRVRPRQRDMPTTPAVAIPMPLDGLGDWVVRHGLSFYVWRMKLTTLGALLAIPFVAIRQSGHEPAVRQTLANAERAILEGLRNAGPSWFFTGAPSLTPEQKTQAKVDANPGTTPETFRTEPVEASACDMLTSVVCTDLVMPFDVFRQQHPKLTTEQEAVLAFSKTREFNQTVTGWHTNNTFANFTSDNVNPLELDFHSCAINHATTIKIFSEQTFNPRNVGAVAGLVTQVRELMGNSTTCAIPVLDRPVSDNESFLNTPRDLTPPLSTSTVPDITRGTDESSLPDWNIANLTRPGTAHPFEGDWLDYAIYAALPDAAKLVLALGPLIHGNAPPAMRDLQVRMFVQFCWRVGEHGPAGNLLRGIALQARKTVRDSVTGRVRHVVGSDNTRLLLVTSIVTLILNKIYGQQALTLRAFLLRNGGPVVALELLAGMLEVSAARNNDRKKLTSPAIINTWADATNVQGKLAWAARTGAFYYSTLWQLGVAWSLDAPQPRPGTPLEWNGYQWGVIPATSMGQWAVGIGALVLPLVSCVQWGLRERAKEAPTPLTARRMLHLALPIINTVAICSVAHVVFGVPVDLIGVSMACSLLEWHGAQGGVRATLLRALPLAYGGWRRTVFKFSALGNKEDDANDDARESHGERTRKALGYLMGVSLPRAIDELYGPSAVALFGPERLADSAQLDTVMNTLYETSGDATRTWAQTKVFMHALYLSKTTM